MSLVQYSSCSLVSPGAVGISRLLDAIGLDAVEELVAIKEEKFITAGRDVDATFFFFFLILYPPIVEQLIKLKFSVRFLELKWLILIK